MSQETISKIEKIIKDHKIVIFMKGTPGGPMCGFSATAVDILGQFPHPFESVNILQELEIREVLPDYSNWPTFPQIFIDGKLVGGADILTELYESGELAKIMDNAFGHPKASA